MLRILIHISVIALLTILTQIGGVLYLVAIGLIGKSSRSKRKKRIGLFIVLYLAFTYLIVPNVAPFYGREKVKETEYIQAHSFYIKLLNRNYVKPKLNTVLQKVSIRLDKAQKGIKVVYLDANFPFFDNFPLLPHKSHNDGKKIDLSFIYSENGVISNKKPAISGYGKFVEPKSIEFNQTKYCKNKGYWQYDFTKYTSLGNRNRHLTFSETATKQLILALANEKSIGKIFIEPNLKKRMNLTSNKIRFHGCGAVRHDDHIHVQL